MRLLTIIKNEILLLWNDKPGLLLLFVMPMLLVLVLTLIKASTDGKNTNIPTLLANYDSGKISRTINDELKKVDLLSIKNIRRGKTYSLKTAKKLVANGEYQALIVIPRGLSNALQQQIKSMLTNRKQSIKRKTIVVYLDPTLQENFTDAITSTVEILVKEVKAKLVIKAVQRITRSKIKPKSDTVTVKKRYATTKGKNITPSVVQQTVPAWTVFGMFLIIVPLAGILVRERQQGISVRLRMMPVRRITFLSARVLTFTGVNVIQLILMFSIGIFIIPLFDLPALSVSGHILPLAITAVGVALAATGFGVLVGTVSKTYEQAAAIGPLLIILAAAVGGIMVAPYLMPKELQYFTDYSPLYWAQDAFLKILVRQSSYTQLASNWIKLYSFAVVAILLTWMVSFYRRNER